MHPRQPGVLCGAESPVNLRPPPFEAAWVWRWAGTLTQNEMAVVRLWAAGAEFRDLAAVREAPGGGGAALPGLALAPAVVELLGDGIAVNSTAELRPSQDGSGPLNPNPYPAQHMSAQLLAFRPCWHLGLHDTGVHLWSVRPLTRAAPALTPGTMSV
jgi:hypothetical protein